MELVQLRLVRQILEAGSLSKAAMRLNRSQSVISRQLSTLERECGGRIFYRNGRGVELTELGERVLPEIDAILKSARNIVENAVVPDGQISGVIRLGVIPSAARGLLKPLFFALQEKHPQLRLQVGENYSGDLDAHIEEGLIDVGILLRTGAAVVKEDYVINEWDTYLVGLPDAPAVQREAIAFADLEGLPLVLPSAPNASRGSIDETAQNLGIKLNIVAEVNSPVPTSDLVYANAGYLIAPFPRGRAAAMSWAGEAVLAGTLKAARLVDPSLTRTLVVSTSPVPKRGTEVVVQHILQILRKRTAG